ncbi:PREDICTED: kelch repeat and BTB domain-containing protein 8-like isoform X1 [Branchiostoma belcheri]|uniref:Kelch repeat and BTB domain-containing protein 8-like isoform X1 n=1 Tax=Branchiostoma belcheri TaxID=7741 RepID=A0A6P5ASS1_BRABE|nr:PREDICTED: kelch repeat and BTB domain-containing protein 8-like isoform X1 [Branchiostoma belcheri]
MSSLKSRAGGFPAIGLFCPRPAPTSEPCLQATWRKVGRTRLFCRVLMQTCLQHLYQAADLLQLDYVRDTCSSYMAMSVECTTCVHLYKFADVFSLDIVLKRCRQWICRHFAKVSSSEEFCSLSVDQLTEIISHDELDVEEETRVWEAVVRWVQHSREDRLHHLPSILPHIRFNLLTSDDMAAILDHPLVREDPGRFVIRNVVKETSNLPRRVGMGSLEMALLFNTKTNKILFMNPRAGKYVNCSYDPVSLPPGALAITATSNNDIYILAKEPEVDDHLYVLEYNHADNTWDQACTSPVYRPDKNLSLLNENFLFEVDKILYHVYVIDTRNSTLVQIRKYNWCTDQWQECSPLQCGTRHNNLLTVSCGPHIYFLTNTEMHRYDPNQDCWCRRTPPQTIPEFCTAAALGTEIFVLDACCYTFMSYDTELDCWQTQGDLDYHVGHYNNHLPRLFVLENQLYVWVEIQDAVTDTPEGALILVYDRSADTCWRDLEATVPTVNDMLCGSLCPAARMYLPWLHGKGMGK